MRGATMLLTGMLMVLGCCVQPSDSLRLRILALFPLNSVSHNKMGDRVARGLAAKGHHVDVYSHFPPEKPIKHYTHHSLEGTLPPLTNHVTYGRTIDVRSPERTVEIAGDPACELLRLPIFQQLINEPPIPAYHVVIVEAFVADCYLAWGRYLEVPMVGLMSSPMIDWYNEPMGNPFNAAIVRSLGSPASIPMSFYERLQNAVLYDLVNLMYKQAIYSQNLVVQEVFGSDFPDISQLRSDLDLVIVNSHHSLNGIAPRMPAIIPAAGIHIDREDATPLPEDIQQWLDDSEHGCVYISMGSMLVIESFPLPFLQVLYRTFSDVSPMRVLLKITDPEFLPTALPSNVKAATWFPQLQVLRHSNTKVFVTHGGLMSIHEAIHAAVPMVGIPVYGDQVNNVQMIIDNGIGIGIEMGDLDEELLSDCIKEVMYNIDYVKNIERLSYRFNDRPMKPLDEAIYWVEYVAKHGIDCLRSPLADMPWWQANLLDVYALITIITLINAWALRSLIRLLLALWRSRRPPRVNAPPPNPPRPPHPPNPPNRRSKKHR